MTDVRAPMGPLVVHPANPRYFANSATGELVYLAGSHTWANVQDRLAPGTPPFDFDQYLEFLQGHGHNFIRLWHWEHPAWLGPDGATITCKPSPFMRPGPGLARDHGPRFDVTRPSRGYLDRLRLRARAARERGFYVSVMLFQGFSIEQKAAANGERGNPWDTHPFRKDNNVNGINGDPFETGQGREVHTTAILPILDVQMEYARQVIAAVGDLDNVLFEISNESHGGSTKWQYVMINLAHEVESGKPMHHPVGMTYQWCPTSPGTNANLFDSPAEWVSPNPEAPGDYDYRRNPPPADGRKVILTDTDHLWGIPPREEADGVRKWVWKSFLRGLNPIFMDPYDDVHFSPELDPVWDPVRRAMGHTLEWARRVNLARMEPRVDLASTGYCLADVGREYLMYQPDGGRFSAHLESGSYVARWCDCAAGTAGEPLRVRSPNGCVRLEPPFAGDALLHLKSL